MEKFKLPHRHGAKTCNELLCRELRENPRFASAAECFKQLSDPARVRIFWLLSHREYCVINLSAMMGMTSPALSHHLRSMRECGIIESRREGKEVYYRIADRPECELLHRTVEQLMVIECPDEREGYLANTEEIAVQVHGWLLEHLGQRVTIEQLSKQFHVNPTGLKQAFKARYGDSLAAHVNHHRMERAAELLISTVLPIGEIAQRVGFTGQSRFALAFKERFGLTPSQYRERNAAAHEREK